jgi:hypothetical protein
MSSPREQRAALLSSKEYMGLWRRGVLDRVVAAQRALNNFMAYGYDPGYLTSACEDLYRAMLSINEEKEKEDADPKV